jgi:CRISPR-associated protein Cmx8
MAAKKKPKPGTKETSPGPTEPVLRTFTWSLGELPSSQHKTGLAGLVLLLRWLKRKKVKGTARIVSLDHSTLTAEFDEVGMQSLFDAVYGAALVERSYEKPLKGLEPLRVEEREVTVKGKAKKGAEASSTTKKKTFHVYALVQPTGAELDELDGAGSGKKGLWVKLWRDFVWSVLRGVPATRAPFNARANAEAVEDGVEAFRALSSKPNAGVALPSTYFIGAQAVNAEGVAFRDRERFQFLLHFWPYAVGLYVPVKVTRDGNEFEGYVLAFPDLLDLENFCLDYEELLRTRSEDEAAYLPREAVIDVPAEGGLQFLKFLSQRVEEKEARKPLADLLLAVDVIHVEKEGNNVRVRSTARVVPSPGQQSAYLTIKTSFKDPLFRRQLLLNLLAGRDWSAGFDRLLATVPAKHFLRGMAEAGEYPSQFPFDVKTQFALLEKS